jgi:ATP-binding cassette subfamily F protein 3
VFEEIRRGRVMEPQQARGLLGRFLFSGDEVDKPVSALSGGERSRLALAKLVIEEANLLLLDEPTNHLDIPSRESLEQALADYPGSFILVSHDRQLIADVASQLWIVEGGQVRVFDGSYIEYVERAAAEVTSAVAPSPAPKPRPAPARNGAKTAQLVTGLEAMIETKERELALLGDEVNAASAVGDVPAVESLGRRFAALQQEVDALMEEWAALHS